MANKITVLLLALGNVVSLVLNMVLHLDLSVPIGEIANGLSILAAAIIQLVQFFKTRKKTILSVGTLCLMGLMVFSFVGCVSTESIEASVGIKFAEGEAPDDEGAIALEVDREQTASEVLYRPPVTFGDTLIYSHYAIAYG